MSKTKARVKSDGVGAPSADAGVPVAELSNVTQDYLKVIWTASEWAPEKVTTKLLAERLAVSASTASEAVKKLAEQGLVDHERYGSITLTSAGVTAAVLMVRRHRLLETYLVSELGYGWDEVHDEAEVLEHAVSDRLMERISAKLGHPTRDPHGDPIPALDGTVPTPDARLLAELGAGEVGVVARIADTDPEMLRYFHSVGITPDARLTITECKPFAGTVTVSVNDDATIDLGDVATHAIWVCAV